MGKTKIVAVKGKGKIQNATALEVDGVKFKSKLELFTYNKLLENGIDDFKYEKMKFTLLKPFEYNEEAIEVKKDKKYIEASNNIRAITYLPDFSRVNEQKEGYIIECKGFNNDVFPIKWKWFKDHLVRNGYKVTLYKPNNQQNVLKTIELIKQKFY